MPHQKLTLIVLVLFLFACPVFAQNSDKRIEEIDHLFEQTKEAIRVAEENAPYSEKYVIEIAVNKTGNSYPAVGTYSNVTRFHYTFGDREKDPYPSRLMKAAVVTKRAASITTSEFLYNTAGQLVFGLVRSDGEVQREMRFYFAAGRLIRLVDDGREVSVRGRSQIETAAAFKRESARLTALFAAALREGL